MNTLNIRRATINDIPFITKSIIEAEKSGTEVLSYSTLFGLNNNEINTVHIITNSRYQQHLDQSNQ